MKKFVVLMVLACVVCAFAFADEGFTVQDVKGRVMREEGNKKVAVKAGDALGSETVIVVGLRMSVVLKDSDGNTYTVDTPRNGKIAELINASGSRLTGNVSQTDTTAVQRTTIQAGTASARASDQAGDDDIAAE